MTTVALPATIAAITLLTTSTIVMAQARYEIGYLLNDQPEDVRVESYPFSVIVSFAADPRARPQQITGFFPLRFTDAGLFFPSLYQPIRSDIEVERLSAIRMEFGFEDLIFSSDQSDPIEVDLNLDFGNGNITVCFTFGCPGIEYLTEAEVMVNGDTRLGSSKATLDGTSEPIRERSGILSSLGETREILIEGLTVPVNEPVSLSIEFSGSIRFPAGVWGGHASMGSGSRGLGFASDRPIFTVPDGVRVDSINGRIRDNVYVPCLVDLDADGSLTVFDLLIFQQLFMDGDYLADFDGDRAYTIFDFLAFQNALDAGCP